jgi:thiamine-monophosphate kinase
MESAFIDWLRQRVSTHAGVRLGPGDDAAILRGGGDPVVTVDLLTEGVDFRLGTDSPRRIGRKALAVNLSDLAAMAARPVAAFAAVALPRRGAAHLARELLEGMLPLADEFQVALAGGDTNTWDGPLVISLTLIGETTEHGSTLRSGARPGDQILVTGSFGGSFLGKQFDFQPRCREALWLKKTAEVHAAIDVSDGLARDLWHICEESGCGAVVQLDHIPLAESAGEYARQLADGSTPLDHALRDGEDFELIVAVPPADAERLLAEQPLADLRLTRIGEFVAERGLWQITAGGPRQVLDPAGYEHRFE